MKVAVAGSGGREHALLWKLAQSPDVRQLYALPGNGGTASLAAQVEVNMGDVNAVVAEIKRIAPELVIIGPEQPLALGIVDKLQRENIPCFGPTAAAARLEASKGFAKRLMQKYNVPTAEFTIFEKYDDLKLFLESHKDQNYLIVKADGLAAGKGVFVCNNEADVLDAAQKLLVEHALGESGKAVILEKKLLGIEASVHFWCDGERALPLPPAKDYKRALDHDYGTNTGGMGTYSPAPHVTDEIIVDVQQRIAEPILRAMRDDGTPYRGVLYVGLMLTEDGPMVIEFNCRFGDPETQVMLPILSYDILPLMMACINGSLDKQTITRDPSRCAVCVVLAADGYPDAYKKEILLKTVADNENALTFHAGTKTVNGVLMNTGGRVLNAVGLGPTLPDARKQAYALAEQLRVPGLRFRSDIADAAGL